MPGDEVARRQQQLRLHRADVLYDTQDSRVGTHVLEAAARCLARGPSNGGVSKNSSHGSITEPADERAGAAGAWSGSNRIRPAFGEARESERPGGRGQAGSDAARADRVRVLHAGCNYLSAHPVAKHASAGEDGEHGDGCRTHSGGGSRGQRGGGVGGGDVARDALSAEPVRFVATEMRQELRAKNPRWGGHVGRASGGMHPAPEAPNSILNSEEASAGPTVAAAEFSSWAG
jgi:hypothetical protein